MDGETENQNETAQQKPRLRERIGRRPWVRSVALVGGGLIAGGIIAGTVTANAADDGRAGPGSSIGERDGRGHHGPRGDGDPSQPQRDDEDLLPQELTLAMTRREELRYGENPHQRGAFYRFDSVTTPAEGIGAAVQHHGKALSFVNLLDADAAFNLVAD